MASDTALQRLIREEIRANGPISFARFMEMALYCPNLGYYERPESKIGKAGDYYTSVSVGPLFGELLAFQFAQWLEAIPGAVQIVEAGAHDGRLALDILTGLPGALVGRMEYWIIETSENRQKWQEQTLNEFAGKVRWFKTFPEAVRGVIFCNELLDAMPFNRISWDAKNKHWFEWRVTEDFRWARVPLAGSFGPDLELVMPDGYTIESSFAASQWWRKAARSLSAGKLCAIDYFLTDDELWRPERLEGTARAYRNHQVSSDLLASPGEQDITAHVCVSFLEAAGEFEGLHTEPLITQAAFLTRILQQGARPKEPFAGEFKTLTHPEHLGERFRVFIQSREP